MDHARELPGGRVKWVETCFCPTPLQGERPYWEEFFEFVASFPVSVERFELTRSDDSGGGLTTQLAVLRSPEAG
jgi:hypothetical protein